MPTATDPQNDDSLSAPVATSPAPQTLREAIEALVADMNAWCQSDEETIWLEDVVGWTTRCEDALTLPDEPVHD